MNRLAGRRDQRGDGIGPGDQADAVIPVRRRGAAQHLARLQLILFAQRSHHAHAKTIGGQAEGIDPGHRVGVEWIGAGERLQPVGDAVAIRVQIRVNALRAADQFPDIAEAVAIQVQHLGGRGAGGQKQPGEKGVPGGGEEAWPMDDSHKKAGMFPGGEVERRRAARVMRRAWPLMQAATASTRLASPAVARPRPLIRCMPRMLIGFLHPGLNTFNANRRRDWPAWPFARQSWSNPWDTF